jgi:FKBP-type peptidyl-prolyl cis-trans isomerase (trigger factor)
MYGYTYEDYLAANSYTEETFKTDYLEPNSESYSKEDLAIEYIADNEGIVVSADDYETVLENYATEAGTTLDTLKEQYPDDELKEIYYRQKVVKLMADSAVIN